MAKTAFITGASRGIGNGIARRLADEGYELYLVSHKNVNDLSELPGKHYAGDVGDYSFIESVIAEMPEIDVMVNNAGISKIGLLQDLSPADWDKIIRTNLTSLYNVCHAAIPKMLRSHSGRIINISSVWGVVGSSTEVAYSASKGGINAFTRALAKELAPSNIQVNAIACGVIDTDMNKCFSDDERNDLIDEIPASRIGTPADVSDLVSLLVNTSNYLTGQIINLDGGWI